VQAAADEPAVTPPIALVRERLARHAPAIASDPSDTRGWQAAVAVVIAPGPGGLEVAVIQRAERRGDPWSGHMALPGGRRDATDRDLAATAARETLEEVGLRLAKPDARLDDHAARTRSGIVASFVFTLDERPPLRPQPSEVAGAWWVPVMHLVDPANATRFRRSGTPFPGISYREQVIWGLTHRTLAASLEILGHPLPDG
jgi:8-oxo-dGTP pyrophosphatase MutT (NUDIX family)